MTQSASNDRDIIEFRFNPRARWEPVPAGYSAATALVLYANYDLRINGKVHPGGGRRG